MHFEFESRQCGHDQKIAMKVGHRFLDHINLKHGIRVAVEKVGAHHRLVKVGGYLSYKNGVIAIHCRLVLPGEVRVHGMPQFMRQRA